MGTNLSTELGSPPWQLDLLQFSPLSALLLLRLAWGTMAQELPITAMELPAMSHEAPRVLARGLLSPAMATTMDLESPITAMELPAMLPEALRVLARGLLMLSHLTMALAHLLMSQDRTTPMDMVSITMESDQLSPPSMAATRTATSMYPGLTLPTALVYIMDKFQSKNEIHC